MVLSQSPFSATLPSNHPLCLPSLQVLDSTCPLVFCVLSLIGISPSASGSSATPHRGFSFPCRVVPAVNVSILTHLAVCFSLHEKFLPFLLHFLNLWGVQTLILGDLQLLIIFRVEEKKGNEKENNLNGTEERPPWTKKNEKDLESSFRQCDLRGNILLLNSPSIHFVSYVHLKCNKP